MVQENCCYIKQNKVKERTYAEITSRHTDVSAFIKVIEIWTPDSDGRSLTLADAYYDGHTELKEISKNQRYHYNEGIPGRAWFTARPQIVYDLENTYFKQNEITSRAAPNVAVAFPLFAGEFLKAVVVFLCGLDPNGLNTEELQTAGVVEIWGKKDNEARELSLIEGYYGPLNKLQTVSQGIKFAKGSGLPGTVWDYRIPMVIPDTSSSSLFRRASSAAIEGITSAIGIPYTSYRDEKYVLVFLSAYHTPIAKRFEIWIPDREHDFLFYHSGIREEDYIVELTDQIINKDYNKNRKLIRGRGLLGRVWTTGLPAVSTDLVADELVCQDSKGELTTGFVMPVIEEGYLKSVVVFMF